MRDFFEYRQGTGFLYGMGPLSKIILLVLFWVIVLYSSLIPLSGLALSISLAALYSGLGDRLRKQTRFFILYMFPFILLFQLFFHQSFTVEGTPSLFFFNPVFSLEGFVAGLEVGLRVYCLLSTSILFIASTNPLDLVSQVSGFTLLGLRVPDSVLFFIVFLNRSTALIYSDLEQIMEAQKARGFSLREASLRGKITGYAALLIPLFTISLERAINQAISLELKGFGFRRREDFNAESKKIKP
ncbi:MAG: energy-coupling factor transporter transmembrane component T [Candidatus Altiarchaeota archaeon]|nr:energy-coupling factor transporter transmembrane component T [Candidatus Altiarchaeota archaeon]